MVKITINYTELKIDPPIMYNSISYPGNGVYKVNDASGQPQLMMVEGTLVWNIPFSALANNAVETDEVERPSAIHQNPLGNNCHNANANASITLKSELFEIHQILRVTTIENRKFIVENSGTGYHRKTNLP